MKFRLFSFVILLLLPLMLLAKGRVTVSGTVTDRNTGNIHQPTWKGSLFLNPYRMTVMYWKLHMLDIKLTIKD